MIVELDVFSGRTNPEWLIDVEVEHVLRAVEEDLSPGGDPAPEPPGLGYRGFCYTLDGVPRRAWNGWVSGPTRTLLDPGRRVERLLLGQLPAEYAALRERLAREIGHET